jgi:hypothetical protein
MNIPFVELKNDMNFLIPEDGKYLVRREINGKLYKSSDWFSCLVTKHFDEKKKVWKNSFDCNGIVTHISLFPIEKHLTNF